MSVLRQTNLGSLTLINYSKYNTDDILELLNRVEARGAATRKPAGNIWLCQRAEQMSPDGTPPTVIVKDFTGTPAIEWDYTPNPKVARGHIFLARQRWKVITEIRVLPPEKLYMNQLEALTNAASGAPQLPVKFVEQLRDRMQTLFEHWGYRQKGHGHATDISGLTIGIRNKPDAKAPKRSMKAVSRENAVKAYSELGWRSNTVMHGLDALDLALARMQKSARKAGVACEMGISLAACRAALSAATDRADELFHKLQEVI